MGFIKIANIQQDALAKKIIKGGNTGFLSSGYNDAFFSELQELKQSERSQVVLALLNADPIHIVNFGDALRNKKQSLTQEWLTHDAVEKIFNAKEYALCASIMIATNSTMGLRPEQLRVLIEELISSQYRVDSYFNDILGICESAGMEYPSKYFEFLASKRPDSIPAALSKFKPKDLSARGLEILITKKRYDQALKVIDKMTDDELKASIPQMSVDFLLQLSDSSLNRLFRLNGEGVEKLTRDGSSIIHLLDKNRLVGLAEGLIMCESGRAVILNLIQESDHKALTQIASSTELPKDLASALIVRLVTLKKYDANIIESLKKHGTQIDELVVKRNGRDIPITQYCAELSVDYSKEYSDFFGELCKDSTQIVISCDHLIRSGKTDVAKELDLTDTQKKEVIEMCASRDSLKLGVTVLGKYTGDYQALLNEVIKAQAYSSAAFIVQDHVPTNDTEYFNRVREIAKGLVEKQKVGQDLLRMLDILLQNNQELPIECLNALVPSSFNINIPKYLAGRYTASDIIIKYVLENKQDDVNLIRQTLMHTDQLSVDCMELINKLISDETKAKSLFANMSEASHTTTALEQVFETYKKRPHTIGMFRVLKEVLSQEEYHAWLKNNAQSEDLFMLYQDGKIEEILICIDANNALLDSKNENGQRLIDIAIAKGHNDFARVLYHKTGKIVLSWEHFAISNNLDMQLVSMLTTEEQQKLIMHFLYQRRTLDIALMSNAVTRIFDNPQYFEKFVMECIRLNAIDGDIATTIAQTIRLKSMTNLSQILAVLIAKCENVDSIIKLTAQHKNDTPVRADNISMSAIEYAARLGKVQVVEAMIKAGHDVNKSQAGLASPAENLCTIIASKNKEGTEVEDGLKKCAALIIGCQGARISVATVQSLIHSATSNQAARSCVIEIIDRYVESHKDELAEIISDIVTLGDPDLAAKAALTQELQTRAILAAFTFGKLDMVESLKNNIDISQLKDVDGSTPLMKVLALKSKDKSGLLRICHTTNVPLKAIDESGLSLYHYAATGDAALFKFLAGEVAIEDPSTPLMQQIKEARLNINLRSKDGSTPLMVAIKAANVETASYLIKMSDLKVQDNDGNTALHMAVASCNVEMVRQLLNAGADVNVRNKAGLSPYSISEALARAKNGSHTDQKFEEMHAAAGQISKMLLSKGAEVDLGLLSPTRTQKIIATLAACNAATWLYQKFNIAPGSEFYVRHAAASTAAVAVGSQVRQGMLEFFGQHITKDSTKDDSAYISIGIGAFSTYRLLGIPLFIRYGNTLKAKMTQEGRYPFKDNAAFELHEYNVTEDDALAHYMQLNANYHALKCARASLPWWNFFAKAQIEYLKEQVKLATDRISQNSKAKNKLLDTNGDYFSEFKKAISGNNITATLKSLNSERDKAFITLVEMIAAQEIVFPDYELYSDAVEFLKAYRNSHNYTGRGLPCQITEKLIRELKSSMDNKNTITRKGNTDKPEVLGTAAAVAANVGGVIAGAGAYAQVAGITPGNAWSGIKLVASTALLPIPWVAVLGFAAAAAVTAVALSTAHTVTPSADNKTPDPTPDLKPGQQEIPQLQIEAHWFTHYPEKVNVPEQIPYKYKPSLG